MANTLMFQGRWNTPIDGLYTEFGLRYDNYSDFGYQLSPRMAGIYRLNDVQTLKLIYAYAYRTPVTFVILGSNYVQPADNIQAE